MTSKMGKKKTIIIVVVAVAVIFTIGLIVGLVSSNSDKMVESKIVVYHSVTGCLAVLYKIHGKRMLSISAKHWTIMIEMMKLGGAKYK